MISDFPPVNSIAIGELLHRTYTNVDENNERLAPRAFPDRSLPPWFSPTPESTKQSRFMVTSTASLRSPYATGGSGGSYSASTTFAPVQRTAPFSGFVANVDTESRLRHQFFALQRAEQGDYIPPTTSDLYVLPPAVGYQTTQRHNLLFINEVLQVSQTNAAASRPDVKSTGNDLFMNSTRTQLRSLQ